MFGILFIFSLISFYSRGHLQAGTSKCEKTLSRFQITQLADEVIRGKIDASSLPPETYKRVERRISRLARKFLVGRFREENPGVDVDFEKYNGSFIAHGGSIDPVENGEIYKFSYTLRIKWNPQVHSLWTATIIFGKNARWSFSDTTRRDGS